MKKILFVFFATGLFSIGCDDEVTPNNGQSFSVDCLPTNLQENVIAFYPFNDGSLEDLGPNENNLTNATSASPTKDRDGNSKCAYIFDNANTPDEFLTTTDSDFLNDRSEFSISVWYQPLNGSVSGQKIQGMFSRGNETRCPNRMGEWSIGLYDCRRAVFGHNNSVWAEAVTNFTDGCDGEAEALVDKWHHVVGVKNGANYKIYFNGVLDETATGDANCGNFQAAEDIGDIFVGYNFTGRIDDIIIYDRELTQSEITALLDSKPCCD